MKIDEAIAREKDRSDRMIEHSQLHCVTQEFFADIEYHKYLASCLELLKWHMQGMEDIPSESGVLPRDVYRAGYNKAVDDFAEKLKEVYKPCEHEENYMYQRVCNRIDEIAQQLKEGDSE